MKKNKEDRRIRITKQAIRESLIELMEELPIAKISVKMLCENADINRSTFYAHYRDQYDLLQAVQMDIVRDIKEQVFAEDFFEVSETAITVLTQILEYGKNNAALLRVVLSANGDPVFQSELLQLAQEKILSEFRNEKSLPPRTVQYLKRFALDGLLSMIRLWLDEDCADEPEMLAQLMIRLIVHGTSGLRSRTGAGGRL